MITGSKSRMNQELTRWGTEKWKSKHIKEIESEIDQLEKYTKDLNWTHRGLYSALKGMNPNTAPGIDLWSVKNLSKLDIDEFMNFRCEALIDCFGESHEKKRLKSFIGNPGPYFIDYLQKLLRREGIKRELLASRLVLFSKDSTQICSMDRVRPICIQSIYVRVIERYIHRKLKS